MVTTNKGYSSNYSNKGSYLAPDTEVKIVPVPVGGWDAISPLAAMEPKYANIMTNWMPRPGWVEMRGGYNTWCGNLNGNSVGVNTLMTYRPTNGSEKLFAAATPNIWDVSTYGMATKVAGVAISGDKFQWVNFTPALGANYLVLCNGIDGVWEYNGTSWNQPVITGVSSSSLIHVAIWQRRLWFVQANSTLAWYLGVDSIQGAANSLDLGAFMTKGGFLVAIADWTVDGGNGPHDLIAFITSRGQVIIYQGVDPTNANAFSLVGVFDISLPIGRRCYYRFGSDVLLITQEGIIPISQTLPFDPAASRNVSVTNRIQNAFIGSSQLYNTNYGWEIFSYPPQNMLIVNIPQVVGAVSVQYVMNALTGAWTQFSGWNATTFGMYNNSLYFADGLGNVNLAYAGNLDLNSSILADMRCAFNYFDDPGRIKKTTMIRPFLISDGGVTPAVGIDADFATSSNTAPVSVVVQGTSKWDVALWDTGIWAVGLTSIINWLSAESMGTALAVRMQVNFGAGSSVFDQALFDISVFDGTNGITTASGQGLSLLQVTQFEVALKKGSPI